MNLPQALRTEKSFRTLYNETKAILFERARERLFPVFLLNLILYVTKMHQRSCQVILGLNSELCSDLDENTRIEHVTLDVHCNTTVNEINEFPSLKKGINLPKSDGEWLTANEYFKLFLNLNYKSHEISSSITAY